MPAVSIVTVYHNRSYCVLESIRSLLDQTLRDVEIIVVDDGSTDETVAALRDFKDSRLRLIVQPNSGFVAAINRAIRASSSPYVAIHGSGDWSHPERIAAQAAVLDERQEVGVVGCYVENEREFAPGKFDIFQRENHLDFHQTLLKRNLFTHGEVMYRRALFDQVGGYREFFRFAQDRDLWLRMSRLTNYWIVERTLYRRYKRDDGVSSSVEKLILQGLLSDFAIQCARYRDNSGMDLLERHGHLAPLLRKRSPALSAAYARRAQALLLVGRAADAQSMLDAAHQEGWNSATCLATALIWSERISPMVRRLVAYPLWRTSTRMLKLSRCCRDAVRNTFNLLLRFR